MNRYEQFCGLIEEFVVNSKIPNALKVYQTLPNLIKDNIICTAIELCDNLELTRAAENMDMKTLETFYVSAIEKIGYFTCTNFQPDFCTVYEKTDPEVRANMCKILVKMCKCIQAE